MKSQRSPLFRKVISPWYDSEIACVAVIAFVAPVLGFGCLGTAMALGRPEYREAVWVPLLLVAMCLYVLVSTVARLFRRRRVRYGKLE